MKYPRIMIAGIGSGTGKTTVSLGLMYALKRCHHKVQPFKVGPDYIDPGLHSCACKQNAHNLDSWVMTPEVIGTVFARNARDADISIIEGVMGLFDGYRGERIKGSSAHVALILKTPIILVINVYSLSQSCVALVKGFMDYEPGVTIKGVVLNQASLFHREWVAPNLEKELGIKVLGCIPRQESISIPERHLGLLPAAEHSGLELHLQKIADLAEEHLDLEQVLALANEAVPLDLNCAKLRTKKSIAIGVARDQAFSFYYQDSLDYLEELGADLRFFSPLDDESLPEAAGIYLGGGFPEMHLDRLSGNIGMKKDLQQAHLRGMPILAEGGGMIYLSELIKDWQGKEWQGVGIVPAETHMTEQLQQLGYIEATALADTVIVEKGQVLKGHEFHYSSMKGLSPADNAFSLKGGKTKGLRREGYAKGSLLASYIHLQLRANPQAAHSFVKACRLYKENLTVPGK